jgi:hypothetical protein
MRRILRLIQWRSNTPFLLFPPKQFKTKLLPEENALGLS